MIQPRRTGVLSDLYRRATWRIPGWLTSLRRQRDEWKVSLKLALSANRRSELTIQGVVIHLGPHLTTPVLLAMLDDKYEREELAVIRRTVESDDIIVELGTGLGFIATHCARLIGSDRVFTFEANPENEPHIRRLFARNGVSPVLRMCMLGREAGWAEFWVNPDFWGSSTVSRSSGGRLISVPVEPLGDVLAAIRPTYLVVDIEGGEHDLFAHADLSTVRKICIEVHPWAIGERGVAYVRERLERAGLTRDRELSTECVWFLARPGQTGRTSE